MSVTCQNAVQAEHTIRMENGSFLVGKNYKTVWQSVKLGMKEKLVDQVDFHPVYPRTVSGTKENIKSNHTA